MVTIMDYMTVMMSMKISRIKFMCHIEYHVYDHFDINLPMKMNVSITDNCPSCERSRRVLVYSFLPEANSFEWAFAEKTRANRSRPTQMSWPRLSWTTTR